MEEQDYIELNTLLAKLRVVCLKKMSTLSQANNCDNSRITSAIRSERERTVHLVRNIDNIRKQIPLKVENGTISIL